MGLDFIKKVLPSFTDDKRMQERGFFTTFFKTRPEYYTNAEYVEVDVKRTGRKIAPVLRDRRTGSVIVVPNSWKENKFRPPYSAMKDPVDLSELLQRQFGESDEGEPIADYVSRMSTTRSAGEVGYWFGRLANIIVGVLKDYHEMFMRTIELQCSQVLQTGKITLKDEEGNVTYDIDFGMKATHKPTVSIDWSNANAKPLEDLEALGTVVNDDGKAMPSILVFGRNAWNNALKNQEFKDALMKDGYGLGSLTPGLRERGGRYQGYIDVGTFRFEMYSYNDSYEELGSDDVYKYLDPDKVIMLAANDDLDFRLVFGGVPRVIGMKEPFASVVPSVVTYDGSIRCYNRVWGDENEDTYTAESKMRGLAVPVSIDRFGCLTTKVS